MMHPLCCLRMEQQQALAWGQNFQEKLTTSAVKSVLGSTELQVQGLRRYRAFQAPQHVHP